MNVTRPVPSRNFDEYPGLKLLALGDLAPLSKVESEVPDVRIC
jgi:hypothetical protein